ncbi:uncharacterized protein MELLADRAFT_58890 [Melampsora larici-populina 98AG31]|uniref:Uncharacterized protein n=1 Tax=Melampsora larici-populina (strain 98AG31 / pathotype 3-4-7) TaxID=747676 RepID=F4R6A7_MELLP|nr:uncharacterized protein MELLADRAFT_58890 [Melampsora larici-populina 98AG31]EGG12496.1 hypothetical protein MELLADRAFT_58890 [Melampsora larici-populina 98AG31]
MASNVVGSFLYDSEKIESSVKGSQSYDHPSYYIVWYHWKLFEELKSSIGKEIMWAFGSETPVSEEHIEGVKSELEKEQNGGNTLDKDSRTYLLNLIERKQLLEKVNDSFQALITDCEVSSDPGENCKESDSAESIISFKIRNNPGAYKLWETVMDHYGNMVVFVIKLDGKHKKWWESAKETVISRHQSVQKQGATLDWLKGFH